MFWIFKNLSLVLKCLILIYHFEFELRKINCRNNHYKNTNKKKSKSRRVIQNNQVKYNR